MLPSWRFARRTLFARPGRSALLFAAIALSSMLVTGVGSGMRSVQNNVRGKLTSLMGEVDARLVQQSAAPFSAAVAEKVKAWPGVEAVSARRLGSLTLGRADGALDAAGKPRRSTAQARGVDPVSDPRFDSQALQEGARPVAPDQIALDSVTAAALEAKVGDKLQVLRLGAPMRLTVCGIVPRPILGALQKPMVTLYRSTLNEAMGRQDEATQIAILLQPGVDIRAWCATHAKDVDEDMLLEPAEMATSGMDKQVLAGQLGFTLATVIAFLACSFIIGVGMTTAVAELERELATLRCLGASRSQLFAGQCCAGLVLSFTAGIVGVPLGFAGAWCVTWWFRDTLPEGFTPSWLGASLAMGGSLMAGLLGALNPARIASRTSPLESLRRRATPVWRPGLWICLGAGVLCAAFEIAVLTLAADSQQKFWLHALAGLPIIHIGWFLLCVPILQAAGALLSGPLTKLLSLPPGLLRGGVSRAPYRLGLTAGALMMGMSILVSTWSNGESMLNEIRSKVKFGDAFAFKVSGLSPRDQDALRILPGVRHAAAVGYLPLKTGATMALGVQSIAPPNVICVGFEPDSFLQMNRLDWVRGSPESALPMLRSGEGVLVAEQFLTARGIDVGDSIELIGARSRVEMKVVGVVSSAGLDMATQVFGIRSVYMEHAMSCVFMDMSAVARHFGVRDAVIMQMDLGPEGSAALDEALAAEVAQAVPGALFASGRAIRAQIDEVGQVILGMSGAIAFAAMLLGCVGVGNVIAAQVAGRGHEFGVLRATGADRSSVAGLVLAETALIALTAILAGTGLGIELALAGCVLYRDLVGLQLSPIFPLVPWLIGAATMLLFALLAAAPAIRRLLGKSPRELLAGNS
ncbi:MAG: ABC transporter permease [Planctomycetes bacterium]|nr:ABC transporter permease [Planctomycetota bacterium]